MLDRRKVLASLTIAGTALFHPARAQQTGAPASMPGMAPGMMTAESCIDSCWRSHVICIQTERYCVEKGASQAVVALLGDCAEMCQKTANSLLRRSSQHAVVCVACALMCDACTTSCETFTDDERMLACARTCRACAEHCRDMSKMPI